MKTESSMEELRYPIGKFKMPSSFSEEQMQNWISIIEDLPVKFRNAADVLSEEQLEKPYRPGGWTLRQVIHHVADSHMNAYCRFKLTLTEDHPVIKPYMESKWAELHDSKNAPVDISLNLIDALHKRWIYLLRSMSSDDWERKFFHPESNKEFSLKEILAIYAWHSGHHLNHLLIGANSIYNQV